MKEKLIFPLENIVEITADRLIYVDDEHIRHEIDFYECRKNWVQYANAADFVTWEGEPAPKIKVEESFCVGERDWFAERPYFLFYSEPKICFEITPQKTIFDIFNKNWRNKYCKKFCNVQFSLEDAGLKTFDMG